MYRILLKSTIRRVNATPSGSQVDASCSIAAELLDAAGIAENEPVHVWNVASGERFVTCAIKAERGSGMISVGGPATRDAAVGDLVIIGAFAGVNDLQPPARGPRLLVVHGHSGGE